MWGHPLVKIIKNQIGKLQRKSFLLKKRRKSTCYICLHYTYEDKNKFIVHTMVIREHKNEKYQ